MTKQRLPYQAPKLEAQAQFVVLTGVSLPVGTNLLPDLESLEVKK
jgi:hypothetical protein